MCLGAGRASVFSKGQAVGISAETAAHPSLSGALLVWWPSSMGPQWRAMAKRGVRPCGFKGRDMAVTRLKSLVFLGMVTALVGGCEPGTGGSDITTQPLADGATAPVAPATSVRLVDRDVEAPGDFQTTDKALWDGRPSLGGVWVAATNVNDPMRVIMRNPANGKFVIGALFRREADNPGPKLQISSDAADALGLVAGEPATINVTALRREEVPATQPDANQPLLDTSETVAAEPAAQVAADTVAAILPKPAAEATAPAPEPTAIPAAVGRQVQIGIFSVEDNAKRAVATLAAAGVTATIRKETSLGKSLWSVVATGDAAVLAKIKAAGFADAYFLKR
jgi:cell division septation protein DedD